MNDQLSEKKQKLAELRAKQRSSLASISKKSVSNKEKVSIKKKIMLCHHAVHDLRKKYMI